MKGKRDQRYSPYFINKERTSVLSSRSEGCGQECQIITPSSQIFLVREMEVHGVGGMAEQRLRVHD